MKDYFKRIVLGNLQCQHFLTDLRLWWAGFKLLTVSLSDVLFDICFGCICRSGNHRAKLGAMLTFLDFIMVFGWYQNSVDIFRYGSNQFFRHSLNPYQYRVMRLMMNCKKIQGVFYSYSTSSWTILTLCGFSKWISVKFNCFYTLLLSHFTFLESRFSSRKNISCVTRWNKSWIQSS